MHEPPTTTPWWRAALVGGALLVVLTSLKLAFPAIGQPTPFLTYFAAILVAAWYGGMAAGLAVTAASTALGYAWIATGAGPIEWGTVALRVAVFATEGFVISWLVTRVHRERARSHAAMQATHDAVSLLEGVLDTLDVGVTVQDPQGRMVYANAAAAHAVGTSVDELRTTPPNQLMQRYEMFDAEGKPLSLERMPGPALRAGREPEELLVRFRERGRQTVRFSQLGARAIRSQDGALRYVVNTFRDVTEAQKRQEELRTSREWFSTALRSIGDAVIATDADGRVTFMNPVAESLTGWTPAEAEGRPLADVFQILTEDTREVVESPVDKVIREGVVVGLANHTILVQKDGGELAIDDSAAPIRGADGVLVGVVLVFRDVSTARREQLRRDFLARATETLSSSLEYETTLSTLARLAVPHLADWAAVDVQDDGGVIRRLATAHVDPDKLRWVEEVGRDYPPDPDAPTGVPHVLRTGQGEMMEVIPEAVFEAAARDERHLRIMRELELRSYVCVPLRVEGRPVGAITLVMAESRRRYDASDLAFATALADRASVAVENARLFRAVELARAEAVQASRAKDDFLAMLGHELRNPLAPIINAIELMKLRPPDESLDRVRQVIERQARVMVRLVDDLLDVSRIVHGRIELSRERVELAELVSKGLEAAAPLVQQRRHHVETAVAPGLVIDVDPHRLVQVVTNVVNNAAKYTEPGGHISIRGEAEGDEVVLRVRDDGMGIAPEVLSRIFEAFVQQPQALERAQGGLGLGLAIVKSLVELHGGRVAAHSEGPGRGTELVIRLPRWLADRTFRRTTPMRASPRGTMDRAR